MKKNVIKSICIISILFLICSVFTLFGNKSVALAEGMKKEVKLVSPATPIEYNEVVNPSFISYADNKIFLTNYVDSDGDTDDLFIYDLSNGSVSSFDFGVNALNIENKPTKAIYNTSLNKLVIQIEQILYTLDISSLENTKQILKIASNEITATKNFDINEDKIIYISDNYLYVYGDNEQIWTDWSNGQIILASDSENVFYSKTGTGIDIFNIYSRNTRLNFLSFIPTFMASDSEYLYFVKENKLYKKSIESGDETALIVSSNFTLGTLGQIKSLCLKGDNLLIASTFDNGTPETSDDTSAIQEFAIEDNKLVFTGFAISKNNSAFNRIGKDALDIEKNGNNIAVIDSKKITLITKTSDCYTYQNILLNGALAGSNKIALGKDKILVADDNGYTFISLSDVSKLAETSIEKTTLANIRDLVYTNGKFYILTCDDINSVIYKLNGATIEEIERYDDQVINYFTVKANGEIITSNKKVLTDLVGNKFTIKNGKLNGDSLQGHSSNIKSFAMDIENKEIFFLLENEELILSSTEFDNKSISQIIIGSDYKLTDSNAQSIDSLKVYTINDNTNVYQIKIDNDNKITYQGLTNDFKGEFISIYSLGNDYSNFSILSGYNKTNNEILVLVDNDCLSLETVKTQVSKSEAVVSTPVDMYYLPLININRSFSLYNSDYIRLSRGEKITFEYETTINGKTFLYGEVTRNGETITGYVPKDFTVKTLASNYINQTIEKNTVEAQGNNFKIIICLFILSTIVFITTIYFIFIKKHDTL